MRRCLMFETAVVRAKAADRRWLPLSLFAHAMIVAGVVTASLTSTRLPEDAPKQMRVFYERPVPVLTAAPTPPRQTTAAAPAKGHPAGGDGQARLPVLHTITAPVSI